MCIGEGWRKFQTVKTKLSVVVKSIEVIFNGITNGIFDKINCHIPDLIKHILRKTIVE